MGRPRDPGGSAPAPEHAVASRTERLVGHIRLVHPFPSLLDGLVAAGAALLAGGGWAVALRIGLSMVLLQASVGALNDRVDAPHDAGRKPGKPIPAGLVRPVTAGLVAVLAGAAGMVLAVPSGGATVALAAVLLALGYGYDLRLKGTPWSWLPFALAVPLFPTYGWLAAAGSLPPVWAIVLPTAVLAGAALAIGNAAVDVERDLDAGIASVATRLGPDRAWTLHAVLLVAVVGLAGGSLLAGGGGGPAVLGVVAAGGLMAVGAALTRASGPARRERGWELEAVGSGLLAVAWLAGAVGAGMTAAG
jgi:4-hydroxybenzoate polyprenyltransferase